MHALWLLSCIAVEIKLITVVIILINIIIVIIIIKDNSVKGAVHKAEK